MKEYETGSFISSYKIFKEKCTVQSQKSHHYNSYSASKASPVLVDGQATTRQVGLWIDHRKAIVVLVTDTDKGHVIKQIESHLESDARPDAGRPAHSGQKYRSNAEGHQDRRLAGHLDKYYDEVISAFHDAQSILIFGPGEAKGELEKRIESKGIRGRIIAVETADSMTEPQIAAKVQQYFLENL